MPDAAYSLLDADCYDEMVDGQGGLRPRWRPLFEALSGLGDELRERGRRLDRAFAEEGVTSLLPGAPDASWRCDPVPLVISGEEFAALEAALGQRARLLDAVLADVYGPQRMLAQGVLPPALVYANPAFLRPCRAAGSPARGGWLQYYAADLVRGPDGAWRVLADRTASASGIGYARENRRLLARVVPEVFRPWQVLPHRPFFDRWQQALRDLAPSGNPRPRVALLTPGVDHPLWYEHMFLSRELSCALVVGADLTVRDGVAYLKTLHGLQRIDVLLRRLDGRLIDPLELVAPSPLGIPGLLDVARTGSLRIVNDVGSGFVEAPALAAFLPALAERLLGERLALPSVPTRWLGHEEDWREIAADFSRWLIRPALDGSVAAVPGATLSPTARARLAAEIAAHHASYVASAALPFSVAPCLGPQGLVPRPVVLRLFLMRDGDGWQALPGALARVLEGDAIYAGRLPHHGLSKDVFVLSEERAGILGVVAGAAERLPVRRSGGDLPSRVADDFFWFGRYLERLDNAARLIRAAVARLERGTMLPHDHAELDILRHCLAAALITSPDTGSGHDLAAALLASAREGGTLSLVLDRIARLTRVIRDRLTGEMHAGIVEALRAARADAAATGYNLDALSHATAGALRLTSIVAGIAAENMVRGGSFLFLDLGRRVERAQAIARQVAAALDQPPARLEGGLSLVLELCDSAITYRSRYLNVLQPAPVLDLVVVDGGNPRALAFQLAAMCRLLTDLAGTAADPLPAEAARLARRAEALVDDIVAAPDPAAAMAGVPELLRDIAAEVAALSDGVTRRYFALLPAAQALGHGGDMSALRGAA